MTGKKPGQFFGLRKFGGATQIPEEALPPEPSPAPMPLVMEETEEAKRRVKKRRRGRASTILAGRLVSEHGKKLLGE